MSFFRRQRRASTRLSAASLPPLPRGPRPEASVRDLGYMCGPVNPEFDPTGAPPVAFRKSGEEK